MSGTALHRRHGTAGLLVALFVVAGLVFSYGLGHGPPPRVCTEHAVSAPATTASAGTQLTGTELSAPVKPHPRVPMDVCLCMAVLFTLLLLALAPGLRGPLFRLPARAGWSLGPPEVGLLAYDIITAQQAQIGMMTAWLDEWGLPKADPSGHMRWMSGHGAHRGGAATMPGMATREQLAGLEEASGRAAEVLFLRLMIAHHRGGVAMADAVRARTGHDRVRRLARTMAAGQRSEIAQMNAMLRDRDAPAV